MVAVIYTVIAIGISYLSIPEPTEAVAAFTAKESPVKSEKTTVYVLQNSEEISFELQQAFNLYNDGLTEKIPFSIQTVGGASDYYVTLRSRLLSGEGPDLFQISGAREYFELETHVRELESLSWVSEAYAGTLDAVSNNNRIFGVPYSIEGFGLICNRDIFDAVDISLAGIQNTESLTETFAALDEKISSGELPEDYAGLEAVCEFSAQDKGFLSGGFADIALSGAFSSTAEAALSKSVHFPAAEPVETLVKQVAKFSVDGKNWKRLAGITDTQQIERFANGRVAVILNDTNVYKLVNEINPKMKGRAFLLPIPLDTFEQPSIYMGVSKYWVINSAADEKAADAAGGFLTWLYQSDEGTEYFATQLGEVSPFRDTAKSTGAALHSQMLGYLDAGLTLPQFHREFPENWGRNIFASNVQSYFTDVNKTWAEVLAASEEGWAD